jgi:hydrogenase-4 component F
MLGIYGALLHIVNHAFTKSLLFFSSGHLLHLFQTKEISKVKGIFRQNPFLGIVFFLGVLAIAGMPPFSIFVSEFLILSAGFLAGKFVPCALLLILLAFILIGFLRHANRMTFGVPEGPPLVAEKSFLMDSVLGLGLIVIFVMGFYIPGPFQRLLLDASRVAGGAIV